MAGFRKAPEVKAAKGGPKVGAIEPVEGQPTGRQMKGGKKFNTASMAKAVRQPKDPEAEAMQRGGYSRAGGGIGSG